MLFSSCLGKDIPVKGKAAFMFDVDGKPVGILRFQYRHKPDWQLRTEHPLAPVTSNVKLHNSGEDSIFKFI